MFLKYMVFLFCVKKKENRCYSYVKNLYDKTAYICNILYLKNEICEADLFILNVII